METLTHDEIALITEAFSSEGIPNNVPKHLVGFSKRIHLTMDAYYEMQTNNLHEKYGINKSELTRKLNVLSIDDAVVLYDKLVSA